MRFGVGYTAVVPDVMAGIGLWRFLGEGSFGGFLDLKTSFPRIRDDGDYCPPEIQPCSLPGVEDTRIDVRLRDADEYLILNVGGILAVGPEIAFLVGAGPVRHTRYREFYDKENGPDFFVTQDGSYWVPWDPESEWTAQFVVGTLIRLSNRIVLRFGYERAPGGMSLGGYFTTSW